jgi:hypothetical protein
LLGATERALIVQIKFFQRHFAKRIRIADATLRKFDDFLCDKSCRWVANFQMPSVTRRNEGSRHGLNRLKLKGLTSKKSVRHKTRHSSNWCRACRSDEGSQAHPFTDLL